jgi:hypothetical protein
LKLQTDFHFRFQKIPDSCSGNNGFVSVRVGNLFLNLSDLKPKPENYENLVLNLPKTPKKKESLQPKIPAVNFFLDSWGEDSRGKFTAGIFKNGHMSQKMVFL